MGKQRKKLYEYGPEDDIRYRGPLSYQSFQILGWLCIVFSVIVTMLRIASKADASLIEQHSTLYTVCKGISDLSVPFLLLANFARILNNSEGYRKQLLRNGLAAAGITLVFLLVYKRYVTGTFRMMIQEQDAAQPAADKVLQNLSGRGFLAINIFVDLFLCTLFMFFLNYRPKRVLTGKKVLLLRCLAPLPIAYELASMYLKGLAATGRVNLPPWVFPLLAVKPPFAFAVFIILAIHVKVREYRYCRHGNTYEQYQDFLKTRRNSLHFAVFTAIILVAAAILDMIVFSVAIAGEAGSMEALQEMLTETKLLKSAAWAVGFGQSMDLLIVAPVMLLFSYNRIPRNKTLSLLIPIIAIGLMALVVLEGIYQTFGILPMNKIPAKDLKNLLGTFGGSGSP